MTEIALSVCAYRKIYYLAVALLPRVAVPEDENIFLPNSSTDIPRRVAALCAAAGLANWPLLLLPVNNSCN